MSGKTKYPSLSESVRAKGAIGGASFMLGSKRNNTTGKLLALLLGVSWPFTVAAETIEFEIKTTCITLKNIKNAHCIAPTFRNNNDK